MHHCVRPTLEMVGSSKQSKPWGYDAVSTGYSPLDHVHGDGVAERGAGDQPGRGRNDRATVVAAGRRNFENKL